MAARTQGRAADDGGSTSGGGGPDTTPPGSGGGETTPPDSGGGTTTTVYKYVVDVTFTANGRTRKVKAPTSSTCCRARHHRSSSRWASRRRRQRRVLVDSTLEAAGEGASRAARSARSRTSARARSTSSRRTTATATPCASTRSARSRSSRAPGAPRQGRQGGWRPRECGHRQPAPLRTPIHRRPGRSGQRRARRLKPRRRPPIGSSHATHRPHLPGAGLRGGCAAARRGRRRARQVERQSSTPKITRVTPMRVRVGALLTIRGRNFRARSKNTVISVAWMAAAPSRSRGRRAARSWSCAYPPVAASSPRAGALRRRLAFKLRVLAGRFSKFTRAGSRRWSAGPPLRRWDTGGGAAAVRRPAPGTTMTATCCPTPPRWASSSTRASRTPTATRSRTAMSTAAVDLNHHPSTPPLPYPGKRPYPNPLDPGDGTSAGTDYDDDGPARASSCSGSTTRMTACGVARVRRVAGAADLQRRPEVEAHAGSGWPAGLGPRHRRRWRALDDERDADADGLGNWDEVRGRMTEAWWPAQHDGRTNRRSRSTRSSTSSTTRTRRPISTPIRPRHRRRRHRGWRRRQRPRRRQ